MDKDGFLLPDDFAPLDVEAAMRLVPKDGVTKGMYFDALVKALKRASLPLPEKASYIAFKDYPLDEYVRLATTVAQGLFPDVPLRGGLRRLGHLSFPTFVESLVGKVIMGVLGDDMVSVTKAVGKAYKASGRPGEAIVHEVDANHSVVELIDVYTFADSMQVGVFEGAFEALNYDATVKYKPTGKPGGYMIRSEWRRRSK